MNSRNHFNIFLDSAIYLKQQDNMYDNNTEAGKGNVQWIFGNMKKLVHYVVRSILVVPTSSDVCCNTADRMVLWPWYLFWFCRANETDQLMP